MDYSFSNSAPSLLAEQTTCGCLHTLGGISDAVHQAFHYKAMELVDTPSQNIVQHLSATSKFIRQAREAGGVVFVHCLEGRSRASSLVIAYLIDSEGFNLVRA